MKSNTFTLHVHTANDGLGHTLHVHTADGGKEYPILLVVHGKGYTLHIIADGGKRYTLHINTAGGGKRYTLHIHTAGGGTRYTLHVHTASVESGTLCTFIDDS